MLLCCLVLVKDRVSCQRNLIVSFAENTMTLIFHKNSRSKQIKRYRLLSFAFYKQP